MKKLVFAIALGLAFTVTANAQESKPAAKTTEKKACYASYNASASKDGKPCSADTASATQKGASCTATASAAGGGAAQTADQANAKNVPATTEKKECKTGSSCCASKAAKV